jgi:ribosome modulation factor
MNKSDDIEISQAYVNGYDDFIHIGYDCPCPYDPDSKESSYWTIGFNDAVKDHLEYKRW